MHIYTYTFVFFLHTIRFSICQKHRQVQTLHHVSALLISKTRNKFIYPIALARTIQAKKRRTKNAGKPRPPRDLLQKKL